MDQPNSKRRAVGLLLVLSGIFVLAAIWNLPEGWPDRRDERSEHQKLNAQIDIQTS
jgi:hypothetical protein